MISLEWRSNVWNMRSSCWSFSYGPPRRMMMFCGTNGWCGRTLLVHRGSTRCKLHAAAAVQASSAHRHRLRHEVGAQARARTGTRVPLVLYLLNIGIRLQVVGVAEHDLDRISHERLCQPAMAKPSHVVLR